MRSNQDGTGNIVFGLSDAALVERALEIAGEALIKKAQDRFVHEIMLGNETFVEDQMQTATEILQTSMKPEVFLPDAGAKKTTATAK